MKTLILGGLGFIGRNAATLLNDSGRHVTVADVRPRETTLLPNGVSYVHLDTCGRLESLLRGFHEIVDLAYMSVPKTSFDNPVQDICENLPRFVRLLEALPAANCRKFVFLSSGGTVYGQAQQLPIPETHPLNPISPYGITKLATEKYAAMFGVQRGLPIVCLRPANVYGEGQLPFRGQGFVATAIGSILCRQPVTVYGKRGTIRDYVHVEDTARAIMFALDAGKPGATYNVGTGRGLSNMDVLEVLYKICGHLPAAVNFLPERPFDVRENVLDFSLIEQHTNWQPRVFAEEGFKRTFEWLSRQENLSCRAAR